MTTLTDLTLAQLTAIYSVVSGKTVGPKFFNSRATGVRRVEALLTEKALTLADALRTAGLGNEPAAEPEPDAAPIAAEPATAPTDADEPATTNDSDQTPEANDDAPVAATAAEAAPSAAAVLTSNKVVNDTRDWLVRYLIDSAGLEPETAVLAAPRQPCTGTKQDIVIEMLRRPEGTTLAQIGQATAWAPHTCRGALAGLKKKGYAVTAQKPEGAADRTYKLPA